LIIVAVCIMQTYAVGFHLTSLFSTLTIDRTREGLWELLTQNSSGVSDVCAFCDRQLELFVLA